MDDPRLRFHRPLLALAALGLLCGSHLSNPRRGSAQEAKPAEVFGRRIVLRGTASQTFQRDLESMLKECQRRAVDEGNGKESVLVIEVHSGLSSAGQVLDVAELLTRKDFSRVRTVAWIPKKETVTGYNAIVALACHDILMHPGARLGDIGDGKSAPEYVRNFVRDLVAERRNTQLTWPIARAMLDPQAVVRKLTFVTRKNGKPVRETEFVDDERLRELKQQNVEIPDAPVTLKDAGEVGLFSGTKANDDDFLILRTAKTLEEVAANYSIPNRHLRKGSAAAGREKKVALIRVTGEIRPLLESFLLRQIDRCERDGYNLLIFEITSTNGLIKTSLNLATRIAELDPERTRTVAYVQRHALGGAAIVALACDELYLAPSANIGDVDLAQDGNPDKEKLALLRREMRDIAEKKHRPPALFEAMADGKLVIHRAINKKEPDRVSYLSEAELKANPGEWQNAGIVPESEKDARMTLTGKRAQELGVADGVVEGKNEKERLRALKAHLRLSPDMKLVALERTWVDSLVFGLNNPYVTVLLLVVGIVCIYLELQMTTGLLGIISALCFALFFWSRFLGGTAGWLEIILFVLGLACIAIEIFVIPGFGVFGVSGGLLVLASLIMASQTFGNLEPNADMSLLAGTLARLAISVVLVVVVAVAFSRYLPYIPLFNRLVVASGNADEAAALGPRLRPEFVDARAGLVGQVGEAVSVLRPAGKAQINGELLDVISDGPFINPGSDVQVVSVAGNRIVVRAR